MIVKMLGPECSYFLYFHCKVNINNLNNNVGLFRKRIQDPGLTKLFKRVVYNK